MKAIVNTMPGQLQLQEWDTPVPGVGQVLVQTAACGICATDIKMIAGWDRTACPAIPGHEWSGRVAAVGPGVDRGLVGKPCVAENVLSDGGEVGFEHPGGYAEYLVTEAQNAYTLPVDFPLDLAALIEPLAVAVHGVQRLRITDRRRALVFGDGIIGLLFVATLKRAGVEQITMIGSRPARLKLAEDLGAGSTVNYRELKPENETLAGAYPNVVEASGSARALATALVAVTHGGHLLLVGDHTGERADFPWNTILHRELELIGSNASAGAWPDTVRLATSGELPLERLISHRFPAAEYAEAIEITRGRRSDVVKVVLEW